MLSSAAAVVDKSSGSKNFFALKSFLAPTININTTENKTITVSAIRRIFCSVVAVELTELVLAVPFAVLSVHINPNGTNLAGIDANVALFGAVLLIFGVFNAVFLPTLHGIVQIQKTNC